MTTIEMAVGVLGARAQGRALVNRIKAIATTQAIDNTRAGNPSHRPRRLDKQSLPRVMGERLESREGHLSMGCMTSEKKERANKKSQESK